MQGVEATRKEQEPLWHEVLGQARLSGLYDAGGLWGAYYHTCPEGLAAEYTIHQPPKGVAPMAASGQSLPARSVRPVVVELPTQRLMIAPFKAMNFFRTDSQHGAVAGQRISVA